MPVVDIDRAKSFYADVFSWETSPEGVPNPRPGIKEIYFFNRGKALHGAFNVMEDGFHALNHSLSSPDAISIHPSFNVKDCKETLDRVEKLGGKTHLYVYVTLLSHLTHTVVESLRADKWSRPKTAIGGDMGFYARFIDSEGNMIGIWSKI